LKPIRLRKEFPQLINEMGLKGNAIEIGVFQGDFADILIKSTAFRHFYLLDAWKNLPNYDDRANTSDQQHESRYQFVQNRFAAHENVEIVRGLSNELHDEFPNEYFDFIYIDANHSFQGCSSDLQDWWPKLKVGGLFAGHDYVDGRFPEGNFGVKSAVDQFREINNISASLFVTREPHKWRSWYFIKE
jgi:hypothetical protein